MTNEQIREKLLDRWIPEIVIEQLALMLARNDNFEDMQEDFYDLRFTTEAAAWLSALLAHNEFSLIDTYMDRSLAVAVELQREDFRAVLKYAYCDWFEDQFQHLLDLQ